MSTPKDEKIENNSKEDTAILAAGCFWGVEKTFATMSGVEDTEVGFSGGHQKNPSYEEVCTGRTGHAECVKVVFDPEVISYYELLEIFWDCHDPTTSDRQGMDIGSQYRSAIFYFDEDQRKIAEKSKFHKNAEYKKHGKEIQTSITAFKVFYPAEEYHQNYWKKHEERPKL